MASETNHRIVSWAEQSLKSHGYEITQPFEAFQVTPYSCVIRAFTTQGRIYLKQNPRMLSIEPKVMDALNKKFPKNIPMVIDVNSELNCFLMSDAGISLNEYLKSQVSLDPQLPFLTRSVREYTEIQISMVENIDALITYGVPDWKLAELPKLFSQMLDLKDFLIDDGLSIEEYKTLLELRPKLVEICELLSYSNIPETIDHCDFHDKNIMINEDTKNISIIDLGEVVISFPFFSILNFLTTTAFRYKIEKISEAFSNLLNASLENYLRFNNKEALIKYLAISKKIWAIYSALSYYRLIYSTEIRNLDNNINKNIDQNTNENLPTEKLNFKKINPWFISGRNKSRFSGYFKMFIKNNKEIAADDISIVDLCESSRFIL